MYAKFIHGYHVVRRTDKFWAGLSSDLVIEQTLMRSVKSTGGLTRGRGMSESTRLVWLLSMPACADIESHPIYFITKTKKWSITDTKKELGIVGCMNMLLVHAFGGCDTTSRLFGIGKVVLLKKILSSPNFIDNVEIFDLPPLLVSREEIITAGKNVMLELYNGKAPILDALQYSRFWEKVSTNGVRVEAKSLPSTSDAAKYHSLRAYLQINLWKGNNDLDPTQWGWMLKDNN